MIVNIFLLCYNEEVLLPQTLRFYREKFPNAVIHILDNKSTDNSVKIAAEHGCQVHSFETNEQQDERILLQVRTHMWKQYVSGDSWIIICDMDEWLNISEAELEQEDLKGATILTTQGVNMVGESQTLDLSDVNLFELDKGVYDDNFSKRICFKHPTISVEFWWGAHKCWTYENSGKVVYSTRTYLLKHYNYLGSNYLVDKFRKRHARNILSHQLGMNGHYVIEEDRARNVYQDWWKRTELIPK